MKRYLIEDQSIETQLQEDDESGEDHNNINVEN